MSIDRKRRIFRSSGLPLRGTAWPSIPMMLAVLGGALTVAAAIWLVLRPSQAPARPPVNGYVGAEANEVAVLDGDTLRVRDRVVRLAGVTAPDRGQTCHDSLGTGFDCGVAAANALAGLVQQGPVECRLHGHDEAGRPLATCSAEGAEVNRTLVAQGWARATATTPALTAAEASARSARLGMWGGSGH